MIDINLLGKTRKPGQADAHERPRFPNLRLMIVLGGIIIITGFLTVNYGKRAVNYGESVYNKLFSEEDPAVLTGTQSQTPEDEDSTGITQTAPDIDTTGDSEKTTGGEAPVNTGGTESRLSWNYNRSMLLIDTYLAFSESLPDDVIYNIITVRGNGLAAEIYESGNLGFTSEQGALRTNLPLFSFSFSRKDEVIQIWGELIPGAEIPVKPDPGYAGSAETILANIEKTAAEGNITVNSKSLNGPFERGETSIYSGQLKLTGGYAEMLDFLNELQNKRLAINFQKITGSPGDETVTKSPTMNLYIQFEIIM